MKIKLTFPVIHVGPPCEIFAMSFADGHPPSVFGNSFGKAAHSELLGIIELVGEQWIAMRLIDLNEMKWDLKGRENLRETNHYDRIKSHLARSVSQSDSVNWPAGSIQGLANFTLRVLYPKS